MCRSWRFLLIAALGALLLFSGKASALGQPALLEMETLLRDLGFDPGTVDGTVDDATIAAIQRYKDFALLPGEPEPSERLLDELRGVAAAFAALSAAKEDPAASSTLAPGAPEPNDPPPRQNGAPGPAAEKVIVPPPPPPAKLKPLENLVQPETTEPVDDDKQEVAELPPAAEVVEDPPAKAAPDGQPAEHVAEPPLLDDQKPQAADPVPRDPIDEAQARIDAELAPYRDDLSSGGLSREDLAKQFNAEGRQALQTAQYDEAVVKFSVAIRLNPNFAGAYSNRGTAYQQQNESELAAADFAKARELGFGGLRIRDGTNPFN
ncbi:MAG: tetratricopeptide repeat protein [Kiloniellaceae bacterium]